MSITFGSVGDIISVSLLVKDLLLALNDSRGSAAEYQALVRELYILDSALLQVVQLSRTHKATPELQALCETANYTVEKCRISIDAFKKRISKYKSSLSATGSGSAIKDAARKIQYRVSQKDETVKFRTEIAAYASSINMLLATASVTLLKITGDTLDSRITASEHHIQSTLGLQDSVLIEIRTRLTENHQLISARNTLATRMSERLDWITRLGSDLKSFMCYLIAGNLAIYREVIAFKRMLTVLHRPLAEDPFLLEDALGRIAPVHLRFITSWEAFDAVLEIRFKDTKGYAQVQDRDYALQEQATRREIDRESNWDLAFFPGQKVDMALIFRKNGEAGDKTIAGCPNCYAINGSSTEENVQCSKCSVWYQRVTDINEEDDNSDPFPTSSTAPTIPESVPHLSKQREVAADGRLDVAGIKRMRIVSRKRKNRDMLSLHSSYTVSGGSMAPKAHMSAPPFECRELSSQWRDTQSLPTAVPDGPVLRCEYPSCALTFKGNSRWGNLKRHIRSAHLYGQGLPCSIRGCYRTFKRIDSKLKHERKKHPELHRLPPKGRRET
ncbi:hypothetical protein BU16DRAFT_259008 [Lophium mytilinum]|uniref:C2H2-type domain-containing protein n=1 Tax=Lophium mytilinum TaxID=390894 RepID=A0A6A6R8Q4_9PEZI|nr:hypothetical protein BU16DRAFT_259008 [Lophium mytilinum]